MSFVNNRYTEVYRIGKDDWGVYDQTECKFICTTEREDYAERIVDALNAQEESPDEDTN